MGCGCACVSWRHATARLGQFAACAQETYFSIPLGLSVEFGSEFAKGGIGPLVQCACAAAASPAKSTACTLWRERNRQLGFSFCGTLIVHAVSRGAIPIVFQWFSS